jgi:hypothetical protein
MDDWGIATESMQFLDKRGSLEELEKERMKLFKIEQQLKKLKLSYSRGDVCCQGIVFPRFKYFLRN